MLIFLNSSRLRRILKSATPAAGGHFPEQILVRFLSEMDHREEIVPAGERGRPLVTVGDLRKGGERLPRGFGVRGGDGPEDHDVVGVTGLLVTDDGAEFPDDPPFPESAGERQDISFGQTGGFRNLLKRASGERDVPLDQPGDIGLLRTQRGRFRRIFEPFASSSAP